MKKKVPEALIIAIRKNKKVEEGEDNNMEEMGNDILRAIEKKDGESLAKSLKDFIDVISE